MHSCFLACFRGYNDGSCAALPGEERPCTNSPSEATCCQKAVDDLLEALLNLDGTWLTRLQGVVDVFKRKRLNAELYGLLPEGANREDQFIHLLETTSWPVDKASRQSVLQQLSRTQAPTVRHRVVPSSAAAGSTACIVTPGHCAAAALPIFQSGKLVGALWLEEPSPVAAAVQPSPLPHPCPGHVPYQRGPASSALPPAVESSLPTSPSPNAAQPASMATQPQSSSTTARSPTATTPSGDTVGAFGPQLLLSNDALRQTMFAVSMCLSGPGSDSLPWLAEVVSRLRAAPNIMCLIMQLCSALTSHLSARFMLEGAVSTALVPQGAGAGQHSKAMLLRAQPAAMASGASATSALAGPGEAWRDREAETTGGRSRGPSRESTYAAAAAVGAAGSLPVCSNTGRQKAAMGVRGSFMTNGIVTMSPPRQFALDDSSGSQKPASHLIGRTIRTLQTSSPQPFSQLATSEQAGSSPALAATHFVLSLSDADVASVTASGFTPSLWASAFALQQTLLLDLLQDGQQQSQQQHLQQSQQQQPLGPLPQAGAGSSSAGAGMRQVQGQSSETSGSSPAAVVEDTMQFVQNVHNPSRDVCLVMGCKGAFSPSGLAGVPQGGSSSGGGGGIPQSLVLLTLTLEDGATLGFYVCFVRRLPRELLKAVRASCQELLDKALSGPVAKALSGHLAPEYDTLISVTPGSYAVVRGLSLGDEASFGRASGVGGATLNPPAGPHLPQCQEGARSAHQRASWRSPASGSVCSTLSTMDLDGINAAASASLQQLSQPTQPQPQAQVQQAAPHAAPTASDALKGLINMRRVLSCGAGRSQPRGTSALTFVTGALDPPPHPPANPVPAPNPADDLLDLLLGSCHGAEVGTSLCTTGGGAGWPQEGRSASIITVTAADGQGASARHQIDMLVSSIHASILEASASAAAAAAVGGGASTGAALTDLSQLELLEVLGKGGGGVVIKGLMGGTQTVAVKLMEIPDDDLQQATTQGSGGAANKQLRARRELLRHAMELVVQSSLSHPNIVQFYATFNQVVLRCRDALTSSPDLGAVNSKSLYLEAAPLYQDISPQGVLVTCIVAEYCDGGSLADALQLRLFPRLARDLGPSLANDHASTFMYDMKGVYMTLLDVALALRHLHSLNLVHRDIKPANLLLKCNPRDHRGFTVKLADFGFVTQLTETADDGTRYVIADQNCGTVTHMAPECMPGKATLTAAADVYSFGILMWELVAGGVRPFPNMHPDRIPRLVHRGARPAFDPEVPLPYQQLASQCWRTNPARRPRSVDLVNNITALMSSV